MAFLLNSGDLLVLHASAPLNSHPRISDRLKTMPFEPPILGNHWKSTPYPWSPCVALWSPWQSSRSCGPCGLETLYPGGVPNPRPNVQFDKEWSKFIHIFLLRKYFFFFSVPGVNPPPLSFVCNFLDWGQRMVTLSPAGAADDWDERTDNLYISLLPWMDEIYYLVEYIANMLCTLYSNCAYKVLRVK